MSNEDVDSSDSENENENEELDDVDEENYDEDDEDDGDDDEEEGSGTDGDGDAGEEEEELGTVTLATEDKASQPSFISRYSKDSPNDAEPRKVNQKDEYEYDTSDEEDIRNTTGNIPMKW